jgi:hypothetical protein
VSNRSAGIPNATPAAMARWMVLICADTPIISEPRL